MYEKKKFPYVFRFSYILLLTICKISIVKVKFLDQKQVHKILANYQNIFEERKKT